MSTIFFKFFGVSLLCKSSPLPSQNRSRSVTLQFVNFEPNHTCMGRSINDNKMTKRTQRGPNRRFELLRSSVHRIEDSGNTQRFPTREPWCTPFQTHGGLFFLFFFIFEVSVYLNTHTSPPPTPTPATHLENCITFIM